MWFGLELGLGLGLRIELGLGLWFGRVVVRAGVGVRLTNDGFELCSRSELARDADAEAALGLGLGLGLRDMRMRRLR